MSAIVYREPCKLPAGILAVAVHGAFFALLYFGFTWQTLSPATMSVELWRSLPDDVVVAPPPVVPPPVAPKVEEVVPPTQPEEVVKPEIALPEKEKIKIKPVETKPVVAKQEKKKAETKVVEAKPDTKKVERKPDTSLAELQAVRERAEQAERAVRERIEQATRERAGQAVQAATIGRVVDEYTGKIVSKIRRNIVMPPDVADEARVEFSVTLLPGGTVLNAKMSKSSGNAAYDNAVERAILKSQPLPLPADATLFNKFRKLELVFKPIE